MADEEERLKALMMGFGALTFVMQPGVHAAWAQYNRQVTGTVYPPGEIPQAPSKDEVAAAAEVLFAMVLERGDQDKINEAVAKARPEVRTKVFDALEADRKRLMPDG